MHYCFLTFGSWQGNASYVRLREFGNELIGRGIRTSYILDEAAFNRENLRLHPKAELHFVPNPTSLLQFTRRRRIFKTLDPDYVHFLNPSIKSYLALAGNWSRKFICDWDEWPCKRQFYKPVWRMVERYLDYWARQRALVRVVASRFLQRQFKALGYDSVYIPYAAYLQPHDDGQSPFSQPTFVYVGNLFHSYDHDLIFEAARILKARGQTPPIAMLGDGPDRARWQGYLRDHGLDNIELKGFIVGESLWRYTRHARALLFPIRETVLNLARCPSKTFAYAQARRPVIACRVGELPEVLGEKGIYIPPDPEAWADALQQIPPCPPDVDYGIEAHNWSERCERLLQAIGEREDSAQMIAPRSADHS